MHIIFGKIIIIVCKNKSLVEKNQKLYKIFINIIFKHKKIPDLSLTAVIDKSGIFLCKTCIGKGYPLLYLTVYISEYGTLNQLMSLLVGVYSVITYIVGVILTLKEYRGDIYHRHPFIGAETEYLHVIP